MFLICSGLARALRRKSGGRGRPLTRSWRATETLMSAPGKKPFPEVWLERGLFASRWLMAPFYVGLVVALAALLAAFAQDLAAEGLKVVEGGHPDEAVVMALSLIDLSLAG